MKYIFKTIIISLILLLQSAGLQSEEILRSTVSTKLLDNVNLLMEQGKYPEALQSLQELEKYAKENPKAVSDKDMVVMYLFMGRIYCGYEDFQSAIKVQEKAIPFASMFPSSLTNIYHNIAVSACYTGEEDVARRFVALIHEAQDPNSDKQKYLYIITSAFIEKNFGDPKLSPAYFRESLEIVENRGLDKRMKATPLSELYEYYDKLGMMDSALFYLKPYAELSEYYNIPQMMAQSRRGLLKSAILTGDLENAEKAYNEYFAVNDSLYKPAKFIDISSRYNKANLDAADTKITSLQTVVTQQKSMIFILALVILLFVAGLLIYKRFRVFRKELFRRNMELAAADSIIEESKITGGLPSQSNLSDEENILSKEEERNKRLMHEIDRYLSNVEVYCNPDFSLEILAKELGSNATYISQAINNEMNMNFRTYLNTRRVRHARLLLSEPGYGQKFTIQSISENVGFRSPSNFILAFKKITGLTPSEYSKMVAESKKTKEKTEDLKS